MMDSAKITSVGIGSSSAIARSGGREEEDALYALIDYCESDKIIARDGVEPLREWLTPWVAQQAGCISEYLDERGDVRGAIRMAKLAVIVATIIRDPVRFSANLLSEGNIYLRHGQRDLARSCYETILELPFVEIVSR